MDKWFLDVIRHGYTIKLMTLPHPHSPSQSNFRDHSHDSVLALGVDFLLQREAMEPVPMTYQGTGFYSTYFLVPKKKGAWRPILDLCCLNHFICKPKFHMITLVTIIC